MSLPDPARRRPQRAKRAPARDGVLAFHVFGDSHSRFFLRNGPRVMSRIGLRRDQVAIRGRAIEAASVAGFRPKRSTLQTKEIITAALPAAERLLLAFGQVDLELGFYYRLVVKSESLTADEYVGWLVDIYTAFVRSIRSEAAAVGSAPQIAIKGVNLTTLTPVGFATRYVSRIIAPDAGPAERLATLGRLRKHMLSEEAQNRMGADFNRRMAAAAAAEGWGYVDLTDETAASTDVPGATPRLDLRFHPAESDHHLVNSLAVRVLHMQALFRAFGVSPGMPQP